MFIYFSPAWKYCIVIQERINTCFCTECGVVGHLGAQQWERQKRNAYGIFVCNGFSFIGMVSGDWHKGRGVWGRAFFGKQRPAHIHDKKWSERGGVWESFYLSVLVKIYELSFFLSSLSSHLPLHHPSSHFAFFSHHTISRSSSSPQNIPLTCDSEGFTWAQTATGTNTPPIIPSTAQVSCCVCVSMPPFSLSLSPPLLLIIFARPLSSTPTLLSLPHLLSSFFLSCLVLLLSTTLFSHMLCSSRAPSPRPRPDIKGSMRISFPSPPRYTPAQNHTHPPRQSQTHKCGPCADEQVHTWTFKSSISHAGSDLYGRLTLTHYHIHSV